MSALKPSALKVISNKLAANFIKGFEGFHAKPYWDYKQWSWGHGTKAPGQNYTITKAQAQAELEAFLINDQKKIANALKKDISHNAFIALQSFSYNLGFGNVAILIADINDGRPMREVAARMKKYVYAGGQKLTGLINRREAESQKLLS